MEATNRSAFVKYRQDDFKLQSWALTDGFSTISSGLLKNKNDFTTLPSEPECYIHLFVKTSVICWLVSCHPLPHPPASHSFVSELMFPASTLCRPWLFVRQSELMQICKLFPFVKCQKNTCKSLALALSCQLALLEAGDKWQSITQHAFKGRGDLFQNCSIGAVFNNISKIRSQHQFFPPLFLPLLLSEWQHNIWELFKALGISIPLPTIWESDGIMGACQKRSHCLVSDGRDTLQAWGRGCARLTSILQVVVAPTPPLPPSLQPQDSDWISASLFLSCYSLWVPNSISNHTLCHTHTHPTPLRR